MRVVAAGLWPFAIVACSDEGVSPGSVSPPDPTPPSPAVVPCRNGFAREYPCNGVDLAAHLHAHQIGAAFLSDIWGWTDPRTGTEWALIGHFDGTSFVSWRDPTEPHYAGQLPFTPGASPSGWRDIKVYRDHAFIVADGADAHGMQIFDLTRLRNAGASPVNFEATAHYDWIDSAHNIVINESSGFAYIVGANGGGDTCGGGLHIVDIRQPEQPRFAGCYADTNTGFEGTGYTHDAQCVIYRGPDARYRGREICFGANETALSIADLSNKQAPRALAAARYPDSGYIHQLWLDEAHRYLYQNDEYDEFATEGPTRTLVWDVADLEDPVLVTEFAGSTAASDHNLYVRGDLMYQSNYLAGLRIFDISDREAPREIAWFDVEPDGEDLAGLNGTWSNYPYFGSGVIAVTSMERGLFLLQRSAN